LNTALRTAGRTRLSIALAAAIVGWQANAADCPNDNCPAREGDVAVDLLSCPAPPPPRTQVSDDAPVKVDFGLSTLDPDGTLRLSEGVELRQGDRVLRAKEMKRNAAGEWEIPGPLELADPNLILRGDDAHLEESGAAEFTGTEFEIPERAGHGSAEQIRLSKDGTVELRDVRYTTCPGPTPDWALRVGKLSVDSEARVGTARDARITVRGVPVLYTPYISFPVGDARKSGLLFPEIGNSNFSGRQISVPWYWNIAPNYDATLTPSWYSQRGVDMGTEFRFLTKRSEGIAQLNYMPHDQDEDTHRSYFELHTRTHLSDRLRLQIDGIDMSDRLWLRDFGAGAQRTNETNLPRIAELMWRGNQWLLAARAQNFLSIDTDVAIADRPHTLLPQVAFTSWLPDTLFGLSFGLDAEYTNFRRIPGRSTIDIVQEDLAALPDTRTDGQRFDATPQVRWPIRANGFYVEPSVAWRQTTYWLEDRAENQPDLKRSRAAPVYSVDTGFVLERLAGSDGQRLQTLEPRAMYLYVPYRYQDDLPIFDTTVPDFNLVQLFRTNRYVGPDRLGDVNQLALGATTRLLDNYSGAQYLSATVGGIYRFETPFVGLPGEVLPGQPLSDSRNSSDVIGEMALRAYKNWSASAAVQWDTESTRFERTEVSLQYRAHSGQVVNVGYRFREDPLNSDDELRQVDASAAWPIADRFALYGRFVYSLDDKTDIERMVGVEYQDCCWGLRFVYNRTVSSQDEANGAVSTRREADASWQLQIELKGLASVGSRVDAFLERSIRGYSAPRNRRD
jgi:LPS-assembly protein